MTIDIPLSPELLTWWVKNMKYDDGNMRFFASLPIRLDFGNGVNIDLDKAGMALNFSFIDNEPSVSGCVSVSSSIKQAQARMFGLEYFRDHVRFSLSPEEQKAIRLMCVAADMVACRAIDENKQADAYGRLFDSSNDDSEA